MFPSREATKHSHYDLDSSVVWPPVHPNRAEPAVQYCVRAGGRPRAVAASYRTDRGRGRAGADRGPLSWSCAGSFYVVDHSVSVV